MLVDSTKPSAACPNASGAGITQRSRLVGTPVTETLGYDNLQRLTSTNRSLSSGTANVSYSYDAAGNFLSKLDYATLYDSE